MCCTCTFMAARMSMKSFTMSRNAWNCASTTTPRMLVCYVSLERVRSWRAKIRVRIQGWRGDVGRFGHSLVGGEREAWMVRGVRTLELTA